MTTDPEDQRHRLDPDSPELYSVQLEADLRRRIASGELTGRLPPLRQFAADYGVSVPVVQDALGPLKNEGLVRGVKGKGLFVVRQGQ